MVTRIVIQLRAVAATNCFSSGFPVLETNAFVVSIWKKFMTFLKTCHFISSLAPGFAHQHEQHVSKSFTMVTRLGLCCVCDHEHYMSFDVGVFFNQIIEVLRYLLFAVLWE